MTAADAARRWGRVRLATREPRAPREGRSPSGAADRQGVERCRVLARARAAGLGGRSTGHDRVRFPAAQAYHRGSPRSR